jgi:hypothetical protein
VVDPLIPGGAVPAAAAPLHNFTIGDLPASLGFDLSRADSLAGAAQLLASFLYQKHSAELALVRTYAMVPASTLPASSLAFLAARGQGGLPPDTRVLALMASRGAQRAWNNPADSRDHLCIPLQSADTLTAIPMMAALLTQLGMQVNWLRTSREVFARKLIGGFNGLFYVPDAAGASDELGRLIIPAQDFVKNNGVVSVFGHGGAYVDGIIVASIFFSREALSRTDAERFAPLASFFKSRTSRLVAMGRLFG